MSTPGVRPPVFQDFQTYSMILPRALGCGLLACMLVTPILGQYTSQMCPGLNSADVNVGEGLAIVMEKDEYDTYADKMDEFVCHKAARGFRVYLFTENMWNGAAVGSQGKVCVHGTACLPLRRSRSCSRSCFRFRSRSRSRRTTALAFALALDGPRPRPRHMPPPARLPPPVVAECWARATATHHCSRQAPPSSLSRVGWASPQLPQNREG